MADAPTKQNITANAVVNTKIPIVVYGDTITASQCITNDRVVITAIFWNLATTADHQMAIQDKEGNLLFEMTNIAAKDDNMITGIRVPANGIYMDDLDSGAVYIYLENL